MTEDARFLKRKIRGGSVDVHPTEKALIVHYETEATIIGEHGNPVIGDRREGQKIIRVRNLNHKTDLKELALKIVDSCELIAKSKLSHIEHLLRYLLNRKEPTSPKTKSVPASENLADPGAFDSTEIEEIAHLTDLDEYLELLYEDIPDKLRASALVLQLARNPDNLEELFQNETVIGALARVLREDWKKSTDLATNITYIFFCFSSFSNFHGVILHFKIGTLTMSIIEHELQKYDIWKEELETKKAKLACLERTGDVAARKEMESSYQASLSKFTVLKRKQEQLFRVSFYLLLNISEDLNVEFKMQNKGIVPMLCRCLDRDNFQLLILIVSFLKKLSIFNENKDAMLINNVIERVAKILSRPESDIVNVALRLLFNLSFDANLRKEMVTKGLITKLVDLLAIEEHQQTVLYILYHLSTEDQFKTEFANLHVISALMKVALAIPNRLTDLVPMALVINLACDPKCALLLNESKGIRLLMRRALKMRDPLLMKLLRNMSQYNDELKVKFIDYVPELVKVVTAEESDKGRSEERRKTNWNPVAEAELFARATTKDAGFRVRLSTAEKMRRAPMGWTGLRNTCGPSGLSHDESISSAENTNGSDLDDTDDESDFQSKDEDFVLECLGCLANLNVKELDFGLLLTELKLLEWIKKKLSSLGHKSGTESAAYVVQNVSLHNDDDVLLETLRFIGAACQDETAARLLSDTALIAQLIEILNAKQEDDEIACQIIHVFYQLILHRSVIEKIVKSTQVPAYLIDLMHDKNQEIRRICDLSLDIISEYDENWGAHVKAERFRWHNNQWLEMIESASQPTVILKDPTTEAVMAAALSTGHARAQYRRSICQTEEPPLLSEEDHCGNFGFGLGIDDAAAFLMSLQASDGEGKGTAESERSFGLTTDDVDYVNHLESMYPEMYRDKHFTGSGLNSPTPTDTSSLDSDTDRTPVEFNTIRPRLVSYQ
ncbi:unnamed protein product [Dicrocoelium dendriticum]|nr:unnamed protein product [Dicrocoelium dendriticum]